MSQNDSHAYWNREAASGWIAAQQALDALFVPVTEVLVEAADPSPGQRVLDVGCGSGTLAIELAGRVGPTGRVLGVDISAPLIDHARSRSGHLEHVELVCADAETYRPAAPVDRAASRFGVMFFADTVAAFTNLRRALSPEGRIAFACWREPERNPWATRPMRALAGMVDLPPRPDGDAPGPFRLADRDVLAAALDGAGFVDASIASVDQTLRFAADIDELITFLQQVGPLSRVLDSIAGDRRAAVLDHVRDALAGDVTDAGVYFDASYWLVTARA